jgi:type I restriction enzyme S subunit
MCLHALTSNALLEQFNVMAQAPSGVQKVRELVLQLAMRGNLVRQDPDD